MSNPEAIQSRDYASGIRVVWSEAGDTQRFCKATASHAREQQWALGLIWFSASRHDAQTLSETLHQLAPQFTFCGCSTSGEITPDGLQESGVVALLLPAKWFTVSICTLPDVSILGMESIARLASETRVCLLYTSPSPRDRTRSRMPSSA